MTNKRQISLMLFLLLILGLAPIGHSAIAQDRQGLSRGDLEKSIRKELVTLPYYGVFDNLAYRIDGNTVTLYGQVVRPSTRSDAQRRVERINGISRVVNNIEVLPLSSHDDAIRRSTYRAIARRGSLSRYLRSANPSIHIVVDRGNITLEGVVDNQGDAQLAYIAANGVSGAFSVTNNLRVGGQPY